MTKEDIIELMNTLDSSSLGEITVKDGDFELTIKKPQAAAEPGGWQPGAAEAYYRGAGAPGGAPGGAPQTPWPPQGSVPQEGPEAASSAGEKATAGDDGYEIITAPIVGTFYRAASPDSPPFVDEGSEVEEGHTLCIIEAMKVMNELEAEFPCRIARVLVENQQMVEYGTPLFEVERLS
jgi:acetyl-CoA carboxylase biotin carboxyl carrier protein